MLWGQTSRWTHRRLSIEVTPCMTMGHHCNEILNTLRPRQNGCHFTDDILMCFFLNENIWIPIKISLKFVPKGPINNIPALVQIMAWHRPGNKTLSEPIMFSLLTPICVTPPQWVNCLHAEIGSRKYKYVFAVYIIHPYWNGTGSWNTYLWITRTCIILYWPYHDCGWLGYARSQGSNTRGIKLFWGTETCLPYRTWLSLV